MAVILKTLACFLLILIPSVSPVMDDNLIFLPLIQKDPGLISLLPTKPFPENETFDVALDANLSWTISNLDELSVTYDIYLEANNPVPTIRVSTNQYPSYYDPGTLAAGTTYYWRIIIRDENEFETPGPVWHFTTGNGPTDPGEMVLIPAGDFYMGCDSTHNGGYPCIRFELPVHKVILDSYRIDKYEVTNAQYARCVADGKCFVPPNKASFSRTSYYDNPTYANFPVIYVTWYDATLYCTYVNKRLPTEAEWEKAARGPDPIRAYPWGDQDAKSDPTPDCALANQWPCVMDTDAVGSFPPGASPYGVMDMAGNVWEWVYDGFQEDYYSTSPEQNPTGPESASFRVIRGGSFVNHWDLLRTAFRNFASSDERLYALGFRCAASP
jgi:formylglycine-generating enzyme required for sulfatase activity